jgi:hypothetical protein
VERSQAAAKDANKSAARRSNVETSSSEPPALLPTDPATFLRGGELPPLALAQLAVPTFPAADLLPLGDLPFWKGDASLHQLLAPMVRAASHAAAARGGRSPRPPLATLHSLASSSATSRRSDGSLLTTMSHTSRWSISA